MGDKDLAVFCIQTGQILKAGITLHEGIAMMSEDIEQGPMKNSLKLIQKELDEGKALEMALTTEGNFPDYMINMIKVGTKSGRLEDVMMALGNYYQREELLKRNIKSAVFYPLILSSMMLIVMLVLSIKVLPVFEEVFNNLGGEMSQIARSFMQFGIVLGRYIYVIIAVIILMAISSIAMIKTNKGRLIWGKLIGKFKITEKIAVARFASSMAMMMASGLDIDDALGMAQGLVENIKVKVKVTACKTKLEQGDSFISAISETRIFSKLATRMLSMGMKTGSMEEAMKRVADSYDDEVQNALSKAVALIEPVSVAVLSIVIGVILLSVMLPLMGIMSSIG